MGKVTGAEAPKEVKPRPDVRINYPKEAREKIKLPHAGVGDRVKVVMVGEIKSMSDDEYSRSISILPEKVSFEGAGKSTLKEEMERLEDYRRV